MRIPMTGAVCLFVLAVLGGCRTVDNPSSPVEIRKAQNRAHPEWQKLDFHVGGLATWVAPDAVVIREEIVTARRSVDDFGAPTVILQFDQAGSMKMEAVSTDRSSRPVAILVDGEIIAAPILTRPVTETLVIDFGSEPGGRISADRLVDAINAGGPAPGASTDESSANPDNSDQ